MTLWLEYLGRLLLMVGLLCCSAYCSGTETAFFSLSKRQVKKLRNAKRRLAHLVADLLTQPSTLLGSLLLANLIVNTLFFATSSVLMLKVERDLGVTMAAGVALVTFFCLVLFGEIVPKSLAYAHPERFSVWVALPTVVIVRVLSPLVLVFRWVFTEPALRLLLGTRHRYRSVTGEEFKALIETTRERGLIDEQQGRLFNEVVNFNLLRVRHVMRPRVDMVAASLDETSTEIQVRMMERAATTLVVYEGSVDNIVGMVTLRDLVLQPEAPLTALLRPVQYTPEQQTVEDLLQFLRKMRTDTVVVVDEYGGVAGSVSIEDVAEELFGPLQPREEIEPLIQLGTGHYRLSGSLSIHDWIKTFGLQPEEHGVTTVGGWVTALLGRIPREDDVARWRHLSFTVERMQKHRVASILLVLEGGNG